MPFKKVVGILKFSRLELIVLENDFDCDLEFDRYTFEGYVLESDKGVFAEDKTVVFGNFGNHTVQIDLGKIAIFIDGEPTKRAPDGLEIHFEIRVYD